MGFSSGASAIQLVAGQQHMRIDIVVVWFSNEYKAFSYFRIGQWVPKVQVICVALQYALLDVYDVGSFSCIVRHD